MEQKYDESKDFCRVEVVIRTCPNVGLEPTLDFPGQKEIVLKDGSTESKYKFNAVFPPTSSNSQITESLCGPLVNSVVKGNNASFIVYGQSYTGKTYTMLSDDGILPTTITKLFGEVTANRTHNFTLSMSYLQVYQDRLYDLLMDHNESLSLREHPKEGVIVEGLSDNEINSTDEALEFLQSGKSKLICDENHQSSSSHAICMINIKKQLKEPSPSKLPVSPSKRTKDPDILARVEKAKLYLCDLAGSPGMKKDDNNRSMSETKFINTSLLELGNVIHALTSRNYNYIPFRNAALTRILKESLGGNSRATLMICVSAHQNNKKETKFSLNFGQRAMHVSKQISSIVQNWTEEQELQSSGDTKKKVDYKALSEFLQSKLKKLEVAYEREKSNLEELKVSLKNKNTKSEKKQDNETEARRLRHLSTVECQTSFDDVQLLNEPIDSCDSYEPLSSEHDKACGPSSNTSGPLLESCGSPSKANKGREDSNFQTGNRRKSISKDRSKSTASEIPKLKCEKSNLSKTSSKIDSNDPSKANPPKIKREKSNLQKSAQKTSNDRPGMRREKSNVQKSDKVVTPRMKRESSNLQKKNEQQRRDSQSTPSIKREKSNLQSRKNIQDSSAQPRPGFKREKSNAKKDTSKSDRPAMKRESSNLRRKSTYANETNKKATKERDADNVESSDQNINDNKVLPDFSTNKQSDELKLVDSSVNVDENSIDSSESPFSSNNTQSSTDSNNEVEQKDEVSNDESCSLQNSNEKDKEDLNTESGPVLTKTNTESAKMPLQDMEGVSVLNDDNKSGSVSLDSTDSAKVTLSSVDSYADTAFENTNNQPQQCLIERDVVDALETQNDHSNIPRSNSENEHSSHLQKLATSNTLNDPPEPQTISNEENITSTNASSLLSTALTNSSGSVSQDPGLSISTNDKLLKNDVLPPEAFVANDFNGTQKGDNVLETDNSNVSISQGANTLESQSGSDTIPDKNFGTNLSRDTSQTSLEKPHLCEDSLLSDKAGKVTSLEEEGVKVETPENINLNSTKNGEFENATNDLLPNSMIIDSLHQDPEAGKQSQSVNENNSDLISLGASQNSQHDGDYENETPETQLSNSSPKVSEGKHELAAISLDDQSVDKLVESEPINIENSSRNIDPSKIHGLNTKSEKSLEDSKESHSSASRDPLDANTEHSDLKESSLVNAIEADHEDSSVNSSYLPILDSKKEHLDISHSDTDKSPGTSVIEDAQHPNVATNCGNDETHLEISNQNKNSLGNKTDQSILKPVESDTSLQGKESDGESCLKTSSDLDVTNFGPKSKEIPTYVPTDHSLTKEQVARIAVKPECLSDTQQSLSSDTVTENVSGSNADNTEEIKLCSSENQNEIRNLNILDSPSTNKQMSIKDSPTYHEKMSVDHNDEVKNDNLPSKEVDSCNETSNLISDGVTMPTADLNNNEATDFIGTIDRISSVEKSDNKTIDDHIEKGDSRTIDDCISIKEGDRKTIADCVYVEEGDVGINLTEVGNSIKLKRQHSLTDKSDVVRPDLGMKSYSFDHKDNNADVFAMLGNAISEKLLALENQEKKKKNEDKVRCASAPPNPSEQKFRENESPISHKRFQSFLKPVVTNELDIDSDDSCVEEASPADSLQDISVRRESKPQGIMCAISIDSLNEPNIRDSLNELVSVTKGTDDSLSATQVTVEELHSNTNAAPPNTNNTILPENDVQKASSTVPQGASSSDPQKASSSDAQKAPPSDVQNALSSDPQGVLSSNLQTTLSTNDQGALSSDVQKSYAKVNDSIPIKETETPKGTDETHNPPELKRSLNNRKDIHAEYDTFPRVHDSSDNESTGVQHTLTEFSPLRENESFYDYPQYNDSQLSDQNKAQEIADKEENKRSQCPKSLNLEQKTAPTSKKDTRGVRKKQRQHDLFDQNADDFSLYNNFHDSQVEVAGEFDLLGDISDDSEGYSAPEEGSGETHVYHDLENISEEEDGNHNTLPKKKKHADGKTLLGTEQNPTKLSISNSKETPGVEQNSSKSSGSDSKETPSVNEHFFANKSTPSTTPVSQKPLDSTNIDPLNETIELPTNIGELNSEPLNTPLADTNQKSLNKNNDNQLDCESSGESLKASDQQLITHNTDVEQSVTKSLSSVSKCDSVSELFSQNLNQANYNFTPGLGDTHLNSQEGMLEATSEHHASEPLCNKSLSDETKLQTSLSEKDNAENTLNSRQLVDETTEFCVNVSENFASDTITVNKTDDSNAHQMSESKKEIPNEQSKVNFKSKLQTNNKVSNDIENKDNLSKKGDNTVLGCSESKVLIDNLQRQTKVKSIPSAHTKQTDITCRMAVELNRKKPFTHAIDLNTSDHPSAREDTSLDSSFDSSSVQPPKSTSTPDTKSSHGKIKKKKVPLPTRRLSSKTPPKIEITSTEPSICDGLKSYKSRTVGEFLQNVLKSGADIPQLSGMDTQNADELSDLMDPKGSRRFSKCIAPCNKDDLERYIIYLGYLTEEMPYFIDAANVLNDLINRVTVGPVRMPLKLFDPRDEEVFLPTSSVAKPPGVVDVESEEQVIQRKPEWESCENLLQYVQDELQYDPTIETIDETQELEVHPRTPSFYERDTRKAERSLIKAKTKYEHLLSVFHEVTSNEVLNKGVTATHSCVVDKFKQDLERELEKARLQIDPTTPNILGMLEKRNSQIFDESLSELSFRASSRCDDGYYREEEIDGAEVDADVDSAADLSQDTSTEVSPREHAMAAIENAEMRKELMLVKLEKARLEAMLASMGKELETTTTASSTIATDTSFSRSRKGSFRKLLGKFKKKKKSSSGSSDIVSQAESPTKSGMVATWLTHENNQAPSLDNSLLVTENRLSMADSALTAITGNQSDFDLTSVSDLQSPTSTKRTSPCGQSKSGDEQHPELLLSPPISERPLSACIPFMRKKKKRDSKRFSQIEQ